MQPGPDPRLRLMLPNLEDASRSLDLRPDAPPGDKCAGERSINEVDREGVVQHAARP